MLLLYSIVVFKICFVMVANKTSVMAFEAYSVVSLLKDTHDFDLPVNEALLIVVFQNKQNRCRGCIHVHSINTNVFFMKIKLKYKM